MTDERYREIQKLERFLIRCKYEYYVLDKPTISDAVYDDLERKLAGYYKEENMKPPKHSMLNMVGYDALLDPWNVGEEGGE